MQFHGKNRAFSAEIRKLHGLHDCLEVIKCLSSAFGSSYIKKQMYDPEAILMMQQCGEIDLYLAITEDGAAAGIMGWETVAMFPGTAELCTLVVRSDYEGSGLGEALIRHVYNIVKLQEFSSVFSYPIASHAKAQRCIEKLGAVCCGFLPSVFSTEIFSSGVEGQSNPKDSLAVVAFNLNKKNAGRLYLNAKYHSLAENTYRALGSDITADDTVLLPKTERTEYEYRYDSIHSTLYININVIGSDIEQLVSVLISHRSDPRFTANLCLNMNDSAAVHAAELLEREGFFFTGFHPLCSDSEYCIFHYSGNVEFDIDDLNYIDGQSAFADCIRSHTKQIKGKAQI